MYQQIIHFSLTFCFYILWGYLTSINVIGSSYLITLAVNLCILCGSAVFLKKDFRVDAFHRNGAMLNLLFRGMLYAFIFSGSIWFAFTLFKETTFIVIGRYFGFLNLCLWLLAQIIIAFTEEIFFRIYCYELLFALFKKTTLAAFLISFIFASAHFLLNGNWTQFIAAFSFSLYAFYIKSRHPENTLYLLGWSHFFYNCLVRYVFSF